MNGGNWKSHSPSVPSVHKYNAFTFFFCTVSLVFCTFLCMFVLCFVWLFFCFLFICLRTSWNTGHYRLKEYSYIIKNKQTNKQTNLRRLLGWQSMGQHLHLNMTHQAACNTQHKTNMWCSCAYISTHSFSSRPFLCTLDKYIARPKMLCNRDRHIGLVLTTQF